MNKIFEKEVKSASISIQDVGRVIYVDHNGGVKAREILKSDIGKKLSKSVDTFGRTHYRIAE